MASDCAHAGSRHRHPRSVAVVDDDGAVRDSLRFLLEIAGFHVLTYVSASEFLAATATDQPACLIVDHHMPQVTGLELLAELRRRDIQMPVALITGSLSPELRGRAMELGVGLVLAKPLSGDDLLQFVASTQACASDGCSGHH